jgi:coenzyme PQQ precursor peptide PqqA
MPWATPTLVEICVGLEINGYLPAEFQSSSKGRCEHSLRGEDV